MFSIILARTVKWTILWSGIVLRSLTLDSVTMESTGTYYDLFFPIILHVMQATKSTGLGICVSNIFQILERGRRKA